MYYLLRVLNADIGSYVPGKVNNYRKDASYIEIEKPIAKSYTQYDLMKFKLCKYRFLLDSVIEDKSIYKDEFHMRMYLTIVLENRAERHFSGKTFVKNVVNAYLIEQMDELRSDFPFISHLDVLDVINETNNYLEKHAAKYGKLAALKTSDTEFMTKREEFLSVPVGKNADAGILEVFKSSTQEEVDHTLADSNFEKERYHRTLNGLCDKCADKEICIEVYGVKKK